MYIFKRVFFLCPFRNSEFCIVISYQVSKAIIALSVWEIKFSFFSGDLYYSVLVFFFFFLKKTLTFKDDG